MIKIDKVRLVKFRGILDLTVDLEGENFAVCGPNGTGKSGVVDAIEFALSGDISRLSGKNRGAVSVKKHSPHVDFRDQPGEVMVQLWGHIVKTGDKFSISRTVEKLNDPVIEPNSPNIQDTLAELGRHRNSTLSRRELIEYVLSTPGNRAEQIQALLQLDFLRDTRQVLQKIARARETARKTLEQERRDAAGALTTALGIPTLKLDDLLIQVNSRREKLGLPVIEKLESLTSVKDGLTVASEKSKKAILKSIVIADLIAAKELVDGFSATPSIEEHQDLDQRIKDLMKSGEYEKGIDKREMLTRAMYLIDDNSCPVCDTTWKPEDLLALIRQKLSKLEAILEEKKALNEKLEPMAVTIGSLEHAVQKVIDIAKSLDPKADTGKIEAIATQLHTAAESMREAKDLDSVSRAIQDIHANDSVVLHEIEELTKRAGELPDTSDRDAARDFLVEVDVRLGAYRTASRKFQKAITEAQIAKTIFETFKSTYEGGLNTIYSEIQDSFADLYREINKEDESGFEATMPIREAGVGLDVDFYGRGKFPPGAYHSEGHQDGMGLCLYLALMDHLYGDDFKFCVLDDVLMSVDGGHRRAVCAMLGKKFPGTQFIFTTHDEVWLKNMQSTGLVGKDSIIHFRNWTVESGPTEWVSVDIWDEVDQLVSNNEIPAASAKMRHYLEYLAGELCHGLGASVTYQGDHRYALGQLLPNAAGRFTKLLKLGKSAAVSWKDSVLESSITEREGDFASKVAATKCEEWGVNATVHYNSWATLTKEDFQPIADAFKALDSTLRCQNCGSVLFVSPHFGTEEALRCKCGKVNINLLKKKAGSN